MSVASSNILICVITWKADLPLPNQSEASLATALMMQRNSTLLKAAPTLVEIFWKMDNFPQKWKFGRAKSLASESGLRRT
jgi:hypothetical protein